MRDATPLFSVMLLMAHASMGFVSPGTRRSSATQASSGSFPPLIISFKPYPLDDVASDVIPVRQLQLRASPTDEDSEEPAQLQSKQVIPQRTTDLKELASQIDKKSPKSKPAARPRYQLGLGVNLPVNEHSETNTTSGIQNENFSSAVLHWNAPEPAKKKPIQRRAYDMGIGKHSPLNSIESDDDDASSRSNNMRTTMHLLPKGDEMSARLTKAVWDESHFDDSGSSINSVPGSDVSGGSAPMDNGIEAMAVPNTHEQETITDYQEIDLSVPPSVYSPGISSPYNSSQPVDLVWDLMRREAQTEAAREPLLVSFLYSTIINHPTLESALSFHLANRLSSPAMLSTQIMSLIREALDADPEFRRNLRADMLAVRDRDPACNCLPGNVNRNISLVHTMLYL